MRYTTAEIEDLAMWEIEAALRTWFKTVNYMVSMFLGSGKKPTKGKPDPAEGVTIESKEDALAAISKVMGRR
jgi:hypothetical protein